MMMMKLSVLALWLRFDAIPCAGSVVTTVKAAPAVATAVSAKRRVVRVLVVLVAKAAAILRIGPESLRRMLMLRLVLLVLRRLVW